MATFSAQIIVGDAHPNDDGINPTHYVFLSENSRPAWVLVPENIFNRRKSATRKVTWIPTVERMLEDALLMVAIHVMKDSEIVNLAHSLGSNIESERLELYSTFEDSHREQLYQKCREITDFPKMVITAFKGSSIETQLPIVEEYGMDLEVCRPFYTRMYSPWTNETRVEGSLK